MPRAKKIDYAAMFSYDEKKGLYYATRSIDGVKKKFRSKDPEELYFSFLQAHTYHLV